MNNINDEPNSAKFGLLKSTLTTLFLGGFVFLFLFLSSTTIFQLAYANKIFPGVHIDGMDIGGLTPSEAAVRLSNEYQFTNSDYISLLYLNETIAVKPDQLGVNIDAIASAVKAYRFGRSFPLGKWMYEQLLIFSPHIEIAPVIIFDKQTAIRALGQISSERDLPMIEAGLLIEGTRVAAVPSQIGHTLDMDASLITIQNQLEKQFPDLIPLSVQTNVPTLADASEFLPLAQNVLAQSFVIEKPDDGSYQKTWTITPENLAPMLQFKPSENNPANIIPQFNEQSLTDLLTSISEQINTPPKNPRFIFNDETRELDLLATGENGRTLNLQDSFTVIQQTIAAGGHNALLTVDSITPEVPNSATAKELGITELVHLESSYFYGSDNARIQNIETAAGEFHGLLIAPGETFSMASAMGDITLDNGYSEALIIYNGKTIEGVGGGVCQVSTTLFRAAFFSGFPITERHPHAYRVSYYEKTSGNQRDSNLAGLDATVYIPIVDLKFTNDSPYWLLMETYIYKAGSRLTWKFYSTSDGRFINWTTTGPTNTVEPKKPIYQENKELDAGEIKQIDWEAQGADVTVLRTVTRDNSVIIQDSFFTRYQPWRAVYDYGPGTEGIPAQSTN